MATPPNQRRPVKPPEPRDNARSVAGLTVDARTVLAGNVARLETPGLQEVARSLLAAPFPSHAQNAYIESLALTAVPRRSHRIGHAERIFSLFDEAKKHIDGPGITLRAATVALRMELERDSNLNLSNGLRGPDRIWHGRLSREGVFDPHSDDAKNIATILRAFARDPIHMARAHGQQTGYCCFCGQSLTDEQRSVALGYGPNWAGASPTTAASGRSAAVGASLRQSMTDTWPVPFARLLTTSLAVCAGPYESVCFWAALTPRATTAMVKVFGCRP